MPRTKNINWNQLRARLRAWVRAFDPLGLLDDWEQTARRLLRQHGVKRWRPSKPFAWNDGSRSWLPENAPAEVEAAADLLDRARFAREALARGDYDNALWNAMLAARLVERLDAVLPLRRKLTRSPAKSAGRLAEMKRLKREGYTDADIARFWDISVQAIRMLRYRHRKASINR